MCCSDLFTWTIRWIINGLFSTIKISGFNDFYEMRERLMTIFKSNQQPRDTSSEQDYRIYEKPQPFAVDAYNARLWRTCSNTHLPPLLPPQQPRGVHPKPCTHCETHIHGTTMSRYQQSATVASTQRRNRRWWAVCRRPSNYLLPIRCSKEPTRS